MTAPIDPNQPEFQDAWEMLNAYLQDWGLESLSGVVRDMLIDGDAPEVIPLRLQQTPEYKERFKANDLRRDAGLPVLSPAEYIATERQYQSEARRWGLPQSFYDSKDDFVNLLANDVSVQEFTDRVQLAAERYINASQEMKTQLQRIMGTIQPNLIIAGLLDPERATPLIERQVSAASIAAEAQRAFGGDVTHLTTDRADELARLGVTEDQARRSFGELAGRVDRENFLAGLSQRTLTQADQENELLLNDQKAARKRQEILDQERARFRQNYLAQQQGLNRQAGGQY